MEPFFCASKLIEQLRAGVFKINFRAEETLYLPRYKGSTLRGAFGAALRQIMCATKQPDCNTCLLGEQCLYCSTFETSRGNRAVARPYVIEPPLTEKTMYTPEEPFQFGLVLIGPALDHFPYLVIALQAMGENGIGRGRGRMCLENIEAMHPLRLPKQIYESTSNVINTIDDMFITTPDLLTEKEYKELGIEFMTPVRLTRQGKLQDEFTFELLVRALLRRFHDLCPWVAVPRGVHDELLEQAKQISTSSNSLTWFDWERYSSRQKGRMKLGGLVGKVSLQGELTPFIPLLRWGEVLHVGKNTVFGLGKYRLL